MKSRSILTLVASFVVGAAGGKVCAQDNQPDAPVVTKEMLDRAFSEDKFKSLDDNRNGDLTLKEFNEDAERKNIAIRTAMFRRADLNGDGIVKLAEARQAVAEFDLPPVDVARDAVTRRQVMWAFAGDRFEERDADADGQLTLAEFNAGASPESTRARSAIFSRADLDANGKVTRAEWRKAVGEWDAVGPNGARPPRKLDADAQLDMSELERKRRHEIGQVNEEYVRELRRSLEEADRATDPERFEQRREELDAKRRQKLEQMELGYQDQRAQILARNDDRARRSPRKLDPRERD